ncbi:sodium:solute symporter family protein [Crassaminicella thermophila]|uniref:Sodium:solute symporter family protein n=1 Tax=Crassaminicella thermophila TaxID=2599308 RepID=A0A5C0S8Z0_CRATE|nr:sodium:solute symporter family protein [Crassaminicella thermophila]QEK11003.1 sodium:solute symporter family protein [Crassaminicella thermophila]
MITPIHYFSTFATLLFVSYLGYHTTKKISSSQDFAVGGRKLNGTYVAGSIVATIVGGASTIGTAQLAFQKGLNAMWFTLGSSIACLFLGLFMAGPLRRAEVDTVSQFLARTYGVYAGVAASIITSIAIFMHITGQVLSAVAILTSIFHVGIILAVFITIGLIISYIFFGGFLGTSMVGIVKSALLYFTLIISGIITYKYFHGVSGLTKAFPKEPWFNLFSDGIYAGIAQGFSMVVGITSTQTYLQAMFSGKNEKESRKGAYISALLIPPVGFICTLIGLYMRAAHPEIMPKEALPTFILTYLNPWIGGITIATLIISVIGTGAGLTLGISTMMNRDIYVKCINPKAGDKRQLLVLRISVCIISMLTMLMVFSNLDSIILEWGFLSMALRGTTIFIPLLGALYFKEKVSKRAGFLTIIVAPIISVLWGVFHITNMNSLYIGLGSSVILLVGGSVFFKKESEVYH